MTKVLLVEDDNNLREIYEARLAAEGYEISTAKDGEDALAVAKQIKPDLIISDVMMPRISGFEMLDILRNTEGLKHTRIIMLTALGQSEDKTRADSLGADRYLVKSQVTLEDIVKAAEELLNPSADSELPVAGLEESVAPQPAPSSSEFITPSAPPDVAAVAHQPIQENQSFAPVAEPTVGAFEPTDNPESVVMPFPDTSTSSVNQPTAVTPVATQPTQTEGPLQSPQPLQPTAVPQPVAQPVAQTIDQPNQPQSDASSFVAQPLVAPITPQQDQPVQPAPVQPIPQPLDDSGIQTQTSSEESVAIAQQIQDFVNSDPTTPMPNLPAQQVNDQSSQPTNEELIQAAVENLTPPEANETLQATNDAPSGRKIIQPISNPADQSAQLDTLLAQENNQTTAPLVVSPESAIPDLAQPPVQPVTNNEIPVAEAPAQSAGSVFVPNSGGDANDNAL